ncbi:hypothetical protein GCM10010503_55100 [Streptomyces lucensis JCM 4490]|uniref:Uncharacterized protein n=1 Tax=Streptomyces lucensis JCM 4490 TaxID=1306176 RepID=A0A918MTT4_9ACTN|nr:hypothetical protein GCM10010503_55100 [Streptomyces lucensis JCM 4490]
MTVTVAVPAAADGGAVAGLGAPCPAVLVCLVVPCGGFRGRFLNAFMTSRVSRERRLTRPFAGTGVFSPFRWRRTAHVARVPPPRRMRPSRSRW